MQNIKLSFKNPLTYYIWGTLNLVFSMLINPIFHVTNGKFLFVLGISAMIVGFLIDLGKHRVDSIDDELESRIKTIKSSYLRNAIRNIHLFVNQYFIKGSYLCQFYRKTGTTLAFFVETKDKAEEYRTWYLSETDMSVKTILINETRATRLLKEDIEEFEYRKVTNIQQSIIDPVLAFLKQPSFSYLSLRSILIFSVLVVSSVGGYFYFNENYSFIGNGSINTFKSILNTSTSIISVILMIWVIATLLSGLLSSKSALKNYYLGAYTNKRNVGQQLITFALVPICFSLLIQPSIMSLLNVIRNSGYFLP